MHPCTKTLRLLQVLLTSSLARNPVKSMPQIPHSPCTGKADTCRRQDKDAVNVWRCARSSSFAFVPQMPHNACTEG
eukprot:1160432-Pelagomonas_calceolata.AAC.12